MCHLSIFAPNTPVSADTSSYYDRAEADGSNSAATFECFPEMSEAKPKIAVGKRRSGQPVIQETIITGTFSHSKPNLNSNLNTCGHKMSKKGRCNLAASMENASVKAS